MTVDEMLAQAKREYDLLKKFDKRTIEKPNLAFSTEFVIRWTIIRLRSHGVTMPRIIYPFLQHSQGEWGGYGRDCRTKLSAKHIKELLKIAPDELRAAHLACIASMCLRNATDSVPKVKPEPVKAPPAGAGADAQGALP